MGNANVEVGLKQPYTAIGNIVIFRNHCIAHFLLLIYYCNKIFHSIIGIRKVELRKKKKYECTHLYSLVCQQKFQLNFNIL